MIPHDLIKRPLITEKTNIQKESYNQITFEVDRRANRVEIRRAIENVFKVKVDTVRTIQVKGKTKQRGRILGKRRDWKKAIVRLMPKAKPSSRPLNHLARAQVMATIRGSEPSPRRNRAATRTQKSDVTTIRIPAKPAGDTVSPSST